MSEVRNMTWPLPALQPLMGLALVLTALASPALGSLVLLIAKPPRYLGLSVQGLGPRDTQRPLYLVL